MTESYYYEYYKSIGIAVSPLDENYSPDMYAKQMMGIEKQEMAVAYSDMSEIRRSNNEILLASYWLVQ